MSLLTTSLDAHDGSEDHESGADENSETVGVASVSRSVRVRALLSAALWPVITSYLAVAALFALINASATTAHFSMFGVLSAAAPGWLGMYQVPLRIGAGTLSVLPLLATIVVCWFVARSAHTTAQRLHCHQPVHAFPVIAVISAAHGVFGLLTALLVNNDQLQVNPLLACVVPAFISGFSAAIGLARQCGVLELAKEYSDSLAIRGLRAGLLAVATLFACGVIVVLLSLLLSLPTAHHLFSRNAPGPGSGLGMLLLSIGYLPNAALYALSFVLGPGFSVGSMTLSTYGYIAGPLPGIPLAAGIPEQEAGWWSALMVLPLAVGIGVGWILRRSDPLPLVRMRAVFIAGSCAGLAAVFLAVLAGGQFGAHLFNPVTVPAALFSLAVFGWITVPAAAVAWFAGPQPQRVNTESSTSDESPSEETDGDDEPSGNETVDDEAVDDETNGDEATTDTAATDDETSDEETADEETADEENLPEDGSADESSIEDAEASEDLTSSFSAKEKPRDEDAVNEDAVDGETSSVDKLKE